MSDVQGNIIKVDSLVEQLNTTLSNHIKLLESSANSLSKYSSSAKLPSGFIQEQKTYDKTLKDIERSQKKLEIQEKKLQRERIADLKLQKKREVAFDKYERQLVREQKQLQRTTGLYNKVQAGINKLSREYNDLRIRKELGGKLTDQEIIQLGRLEAKLQKYQGVLKRVDANIGKHQRNVGNYKSTFDGLGFSIAQLSREMPAFANSMQTGFMAISNNIPMLVDEIGRLKQANVELAASGKPTVNILKRVGKAIFSLQGLLGVGITILTVFAPKLIDWAFGMSEAEKATKKATEELKEQNKALKENLELRKRQLSGIKDFINSAEIVDEFKHVFSNVFEGSEDAEAVLRELSDRLEKIGVDAKALTNLDIIQSDRLVIAANLLAIEEQRIKLEEERNRIDTELKKKADIERRLASGELSVSRARTEALKLGNTNLNETIKIQKRINQLQEANNSIIGKTVELESEVKEIKKEQQDLTFVDPASEEAIRRQISELEQLKSKVEINSTAYNGFTFQIKLLKTILDGLTGSFKDHKKSVEEAAAEYPDFQKNMEEAIKQIEKLREETELALKGEAFELFSDAGFGSLTQFFDGTFKKLMDGADTLEKKFAVTFNAITDVARDAFAMMQQFGQQNFEAQYERLETQKNVAIQFAGESTTAREEIERQYENKRKQIQREQAKAQKETAIFNAVIGTAQAVVSALAVGPPQGYVLAALSAALGAAQIAVISSQQIPQYWQGGVVGSQQQIMVNDDPYGKKGSNYKEVVRKPNGQVLTPQGKNVKMTVPKGTEIFPTYDAFMSTLNNELGLNGIGMSNIQPNINISSGITEGQIRGVMAEHGKNVVNAINNKTEYHMSWDENGMNKYVVNGNSKQKILNARFRGKGRQV